MSDDDLTYCPKCGAVFPAWHVAHWCKPKDD